MSDVRQPLVARQGPLCVAALWLDALAVLSLVVGFIVLYVGAEGGVDAAVWTGLGLVGPVPVMCTAFGMIRSLQAVRLAAHEASRGKSFWVTVPVAAVSCLLLLAFGSYTLWILVTFAIGN